MTRFAARGHDVRVLCGDEHVPELPARPTTAARASACTGSCDRTGVRGSEWRPTLRETAGDRAPQPGVLDRHLARVPPRRRVGMAHGGDLGRRCCVTCTDRGIPVVDVVCDDWPVYMEQFDAWTSLFDGSACGPGRAGSWQSVTLTGLPTRSTASPTTGVFCFVSDSHVGARSRRLPVGLSDVGRGVQRHRGRATFPSTAARQQRARGRGGCSTSGASMRPRASRRSCARSPTLPAEATLACYGRGADQERERLGAARRVARYRATASRSAHSSARSCRGVPRGRRRRVPERVAGAVWARPARGDGVRHARGRRRGLADRRSSCATATTACSSPPAMPRRSPAPCAGCTTTPRSRATLVAGGHSPSTNSMWTAWPTHSRRGTSPRQPASRRRPADRKLALRPAPGVV